MIPRWSCQLLAVFSATAVLVCALPLLAQDDSGLGDIDIPQQRMPLCFGFSDIQSPRALEICDALNLGENVKARELSENWLRNEPNNPAAQFAIAEVLFTVEGNLPRALFHLNRAEELTGYETLEEAFDAGNLQWHYLTLSQLSYVHQLMGDQLASLDYLDKINRIYGQDIESFRGWPLIKLKQYEAARASANSVLESSDDQRARARAWNTLCAVELASLQPVESMGACERAINEDEENAGQSGSYDTVYLSNAAEVALSLLQIDRAEEYLDRATRYLNPDSVADPWVYKLYLTMNQSRFSDAMNAMDRMLVWRQQQEPVVTVMNRAEHFLVSASFLLLAGYAEDAVELTSTALNQPDRNGSYSADDAQKDAYAALLNMVANRTAYQTGLEELATEGRLAGIPERLQLQSYRLAAWQAERRAASLFAEFDVLQNRLRPYAPLDVHIPEWIEPEIIRIMGTGVMRNLLEQAYNNGAFQLNEGYYFAYQAEIAAVAGNHAAVLGHGERAIANLPQAESLLTGRLAARMGDAAWRLGDDAAALRWYQQALTRDPSVVRRLGLALPVQITHDGSALSTEVASYLQRSPRTVNDSNGFIISIDGSAPSVCLSDRAGQTLSCYNYDESDAEDDADLARVLARQFHTETFGLGLEISKAKRSMLLGSSVILNGQNTANQRSRDAFLTQ